MIITDSFSFPKYYRANCIKIYKITSLQTKQTHNDTECLVIVQVYCSHSVVDIVLLFVRVSTEPYDILTVFHSYFSSLILLLRSRGYPTISYIHVGYPKAHIIDINVSLSQTDMHALSLEFRVYACGIYLHALSP